MYKYVVSMQRWNGKQMVVDKHEVKANSRHEAALVASCDYNLAGEVVAVGCLGFA